ncbi:hypothetical protein BBO99_00000180 [Phytophthora kernoviae]|uniref:TatD related DNase n=2 Tax=Phytophthora kernoviae TaxID=325452 RepID=A0A3R7HP77_9STRA|nr:hypothetical protein G195_001383 [Phytophthora kernoviae 00238/432]KAG2531449.1 hypothetical protein JM18_000358 [Phytophthora kernoviae]KAG2532665.1 hypothetical protein JM16_000253 [Phytophthora kernoviae]RLM96842.1 hypothetical protein BBI17_000282 [Phytophthora kernoviae]RLN85841.1 hypothetical protein BBO99_00000180 [Phytophthora kernoviae]
MVAAETSFPPPGHDELSTNAWYYVHQASIPSIKTKLKKSRGKPSSKSTKMGFPEPSFQKSWFKTQLAMACTLRKPLFLHERLAHQDFMELIDQVTKEFDGYFPPAVVHCFTGKEDELKTYVARDWYVGITGFICKKHGAELREMVRHVPLDRLVLETDAPYMGFPKCRRAELNDVKKQYPNVPSAMPQVAQAVATALGQSPQEIARLTRANARRFLRL